MLDKLAKKDRLWREIAFKICKDKTLADDIVNEMYIRRHDNDRGQELTDYYVICTMNSIYMNYKLTNKYVPVENIRTNAVGFVPFEPNDTEYVLLQRAKELPFAKRELISLNYDYSLREIVSRLEGSGISYGTINYTLRKSRQQILQNKIHLYKNKRLKHMPKLNKMNEKLNKVTKELDQELDELKQKVKLKIDNRDYLGAHKNKIEYATIKKCINKINKANTK